MAEAATSSAPQRVAVIDIGSSAMRMIVAELKGPGEWRLLDAAERPLQLGRDAFMDGRIGRETIGGCLQILTGFLELAAPYEVSTIRAIGTSALRVAQNRETFIDRVNLQLGIDIEIIEGVESNYLTYLAVRHALEPLKPGLGRTNSLIIEVGGGSTEVILLRRGRMAAAHTLDIGTVRTDQVIRSLAAEGGAGAQMSRFVRDNMRSDLEDIEAEMHLSRISRFVAVGGDARWAAKTIGEEADGVSRIRRGPFLKLVETLETMSTVEVVDAYGVSFSDAEALVPALLVYREFLLATSAKTLIVPSVSIRDGVLIEMTHGGESTLRDDFYQQVIAAAESLGRRYHYDSEHARFVADISLALFDLLGEDHGLNRHHRLLLEVAALLHDIGHFINFHSHHKHGHYIITNSDIFGLHREDVDIVANAVRYHRRGVPLARHSAYAALSSDARLAVLKLAALVRVAEGLDYSHSQRIGRPSLALDGDDLVVRCRPTGNVSLEQMSLRAKVGLFEEVFGLRVLIEQRPARMQNLSR
jgi:exopolyphosphatase/guanosine-5'-triphosphate,3'-diphosphate pyrophosphatase